MHVDDKALMLILINFNFNVKTSNFLYVFVNKYDVKILQISKI